MSEAEVLSDIYGDSIEFQSKTEFQMKFLPCVGNEGDKAFVFVQMRFLLPEKYPQESPSFSIVKQKGLDEDNVNRFKLMIKAKYIPITNINRLDELAKRSKESSEKSGYLYDSMDYILTTLTDINDSVLPRSGFCLDWREVRYMFGRIR